MISEKKPLNFEDLLRRKLKSYNFETSYLEESLAESIEYDAPWVLRDCVIAILETRKKDKLYIEDENERKEWEKDHVL